MTDAQWNLFVPHSLITRLSKEQKNFLFAQIKANNYNLCFYTHDRAILDKVPENFTFQFFTRRRPYKRFDSVTNFFDVPIHASHSVILGYKDEDLHLAANKKILLMAPMWETEVSQLVRKYGLHISSLKILVSMLKVLKNQTKWFYRLELSDKSTLIALSSANDYGASEDEKVVIDKFRDVLKRGGQEYRDALLFHFLSGVSKSQELRQIDIWAAMPSSKGPASLVLHDFKEHCRYLTSKKIKDDLLIRHTATQASHFTAAQVRKTTLQADKHLRSMRLNPGFQTKLKGKVVCVIDDYVTYGTTTEAVRALLENAGVSKVIFVALGRYLSGAKGIYKREEYKLQGDVFSPNFQFELISEDPNFGQNAAIDFGARNEVERIRTILEGGDSNEPKN